MGGEGRARGGASVDRRGSLAIAIEAAQDEAIDQESAVLAPATGVSSSLLTRAHVQLSGIFGGAHVLTVPLIATDKAVGAVTLRRNDRGFTQEEINLADTLASEWRLA